MAEFKLSRIRLNYVAGINHIIDDMIQLQWLYLCCIKNTYSRLYNDLVELFEVKLQMEKTREGVVWLVIGSTSTFYLLVAL